MNQGAFRDASAAIERALMLEKDNEELRAELADLAELRVKAEEVERLRAEVDQLRSVARGENEDAYMRRVGEERDELQQEVRELRDRLAAQEGDLAVLRRFQRQHYSRDPLTRIAESIADLLGRRRKNKDE